MNEPQGTILIDITPGSGAEFDRSFLQRTGHDVVLCHGPDDGQLCPCSRALAVSSSSVLTASCSPSTSTRINIGRSCSGTTRSPGRRCRSGRWCTQASASGTPTCSDRSRCGSTNRRWPTSTGSPPASRPPTEAPDRRCPHGRLAAVLGVRLCRGCHPSVARRGSSGRGRHRCLTTSPWLPSSASSSTLHDAYMFANTDSSVEPAAAV